MYTTEFAEKVSNFYSSYLYQLYILGMELMKIQGFS